MKSIGLVHRNPSCAKKTVIGLLPHGLITQVADRHHEGFSVGLRKYFNEVGKESRSLSPVDVNSLMEGSVPTLPNQFRG